MELPFPIITRSWLATRREEAKEVLASKEGCFLLLDKPYGETSFFVVNELRKRLSRLTDVKWIKVGHAGTLDPLATGLLIIAVRGATRSIESLMGLEKTYLAQIRLGITSPSYDLESPIEVRTTQLDFSPVQILDALSAKKGEQWQLPPQFSAVKVAGKPIYLQARKGEAVEIEPRKVTVHDLEVLEVNLPFVTFRMSCSKGTYVRSFVHEIGEELGCGAVLVDLRREEIGKFSVDDALLLKEATELISTSGTS